MVNGNAIREQWQTEMYTKGQGLICYVLIYFFKKGVTLWCHRSAAITRSAAHSWETAKKATSSDIAPIEWWIAKWGRRERETGTRARGRKRELTRQQHLLLRRRKGHKWYGEKHERRRRMQARLLDKVKATARTERVLRERERSPTRLPDNEVNTTQEVEWDREFKREQRVAKYRDDRETTEESITSRFQDAKSLLCRGWTQEHDSVITFDHVCER